MGQVNARRLYFLRHGLADRSAWSGSDYERPLTPLGKERMAQEARTMQALNLGLDLIVTSPLTRARQTAEIVAEQLDLGDRVQENELLAFGLGPAGLNKLLDQYPGAEHLLLVGHEPDFSHIIGAITGGSDVVCKKGSLARIDLTATSPVTGDLVWLIPPKVLARE